MNLSTYSTSLLVSNNIHYLSNVNLAIKYLKLQKENNINNLYVDYLYIHKFKALLLVHYIYLYYLYYLCLLLFFRI